MNARLPVVGVISCGRSVEGETAQAVKHRYLDAVMHHAGAVPVLLPSNQPAANAAPLTDRVDALLLTGSNSNIAPGRYGGSHEALPPVDEDRDEFGLALIAAAIAARKPVLGVCRGLQEINVAFGGSLRDLRGGTDAILAHHAPDGVPLDVMFGHVHRVDVAPGSPLAQMTGAAAFEVNSVHFQVIDRLGEGLAVSARGADGVIEAIHSTETEAPVVAVQWHPEWRPEGRPHDLALWTWFGELARGEGRRIPPPDTPG